MKFTVTRHEHIRNNKKYQLAFCVRKHLIGYSVICSVVSDTKIVSTCDRACEIMQDYLNTQKHWERTFRKPVFEQKYVEKAIRKNYGVED